MTVQTISHEEMMRDYLRDPDAREDWERSAFARAIASQVIRYRIENNLSQRALASRMGVSQGLVARLEQGEHEPRFSTLQSLTRSLKMSFVINIHPKETAPAKGFSIGDERVERATEKGVETLVLASS